MTNSKSAMDDLVGFKRSALARSIRQITLPRACALAAMTITAPAFAQSFSASIELSELDGSDGFKLNGSGFLSYTGSSVSGAGDINGDGTNDLIIGAPLAGRNYDNSGASFVVFGGGGVGDDGMIDLTNLGSAGFVIYGDNSDGSGITVSEAGDINDDGVGDLIIASQDGGSHVVFGGSAIGAGGVIELSELDGSDGFVLSDPDAVFSGRASAAGDFNGDGIDDVLIGESLTRINGQTTGESYVVFGGPGVGANGAVDLANLDGENGFALLGMDDDDRAGYSVSAAGDVNGDGADDVIIGAFQADPNGVHQTWMGPTVLCSTVLMRVTNQVVR